MTADSAADLRSDAESITSLRGEGPRVVRLSRKAIAIAGAGGMIMVAGALVYALQPPPPTPEEELYKTDGVAVADGLASAPSDYSQVPQLGPPLPGDLGKPILDAQDRGAVAELPPVGAEPPPPSPRSISAEEAARQRLEQERETARGSRLFVSGASPSLGKAQPAPPSGAVAIPVKAAVAETGPASQDRPAERRTLSLQSFAASPSEMLQAGSVIPAALITGIRSDQAGLVTAQVTENVYDSLTGRRLLIPQGSRLIGEYDSDVGFGQRRVLLAWNRLILPDGRSLMLEGEPAADPSGYAGLEDGVDYHWGGVLKAALVSTLLGAGSELGSGSDSDLVRALRRGSQDSIGRAGEQVVSRQLNVRPTLTIRPGYPVRVLVTRDIVLEGES
ncbi:MAG: TrbI/VirB10 family protein [Qipengyuania pacifica]|jgi:type IV secretion system protein VirB10|tara:strand:- start:13931 stop:15100 length:1170 start_codon:yes stop_codon:yes gene_type:complete